MRSWCSWLGVALLTAGVVGCADEASPRGQLLVVVDTNVPLTGQLAADPELSFAASVDTLRVDVLDGTAEVTAFSEFVVPDAWSWPLSFGVQADGHEDIRLRLRVFRGEYAEPEQAADGEALRPRPELAIDRLVRLPLPGEDDGVRIRQVLLDGDCWGLPAAPDQDLGCVDRDRLSAPASEGVEQPDGVASASQAGQWPHGRSKPCLHPQPHPEAICIPGGFTILGDLALQEGAHAPFTFPASGLRAVVLSAFWLDRTEFTVGRMRGLFLRGDYPGNVSTKNPSHPVGALCTWLSTQDPAMDAFPVVCLALEVAAASCEKEGGALPSEAQWEHAARGRGQGRRFPWGEVSPRCCTASLQQGVLCPLLGVDDGPEPVGAHEPSLECDGLGDRSRDGLLDLGGNVSEWASDVLAPYDAPCWDAPGLLHDPVCLQSEVGIPAARGAAFLDGPLAAAASQRFLGDIPGPYQGFRCAYLDAPIP